MSRENREAAAALYELYEQGDIGAMVSRMDPDLEVDLSDRLPDEGVLHGREAYRAFLETSFDVWAEFRIEVEELLEAGDAVVALVKSSAIGQGSGVKVEERIAHVAWMRSGVPYRLKVFTDRARALKAVGLKR